MLSAVYALDEGARYLAGMQTRVRSAAQADARRGRCGCWSLALLLATAAGPVDALARLRRRREPVRAGAMDARVRAPVPGSALFAVLLGALGIVAAPAGQLSATALSADGSILAATLADRARACARALVPGRRSPDVWAASASHAEAAGARGAARATRRCPPRMDLQPVCLLVADTRVASVAGGHGARAAGRAASSAHWPTGRSRSVRCSPLLLALVYARELGLGVGGLAESAVLALAGGQLGLFGVLLWSVALGCLFAALLLAPPSDLLDAPGIEGWPEVADPWPGVLRWPWIVGRHRVRTAPLKSHDSTARQKAHSKRFVAGAA